MKGKVYFVACADRIKIGYSTDIMKRMRSFATASALKFDFICDVPGTKAFEKAIHQKMNAHRIHGEWFADCPELRDLIAAVKQDGYAAIGFVEPTPAEKRDAPPKIERLPPQIKQPVNLQSPFRVVFDRLNSAIDKYVGESVCTIREREKKLGLTPGTLINKTFDGYWTPHRGAMALAMVKATVDAVEALASELKDSCFSDDPLEHEELVPLGMEFIANLDRGLYRLFESADSSVTDDSAFKAERIEARAA